jgi:hypothetical protein
VEEVDSARRAAADCRDFERLRIALIGVAGHEWGSYAAKVAHEGYEATLPVFGTVNIPTTGALEILIPFVSLFLLARWLGWKR